MGVFSPSGVSPSGSTVVVQGTTADTITNFTIVAANIEYSYTLPAGTKHFMLKLRTADGSLKLANTVGQSGTQYWTVPRGCSYGLSDLSLATGKTYYFQATVTGILEIHSWQV